MPGGNILDYPTKRIKTEGFKEALQICVDKGYIMQEQMEEEIECLVEKKTSIEDLDDDELLKVIQDAIASEIKRKKAAGLWVSFFDPIKKQVYRQYPDGHIEYVTGQIEIESNKGKDKRMDYKICLTNKLLGWFYSSLVQTLVEILTKEGVNGRSYTIFDIRDESTCLIFENGQYHMFYYERGQRTNEEYFEDLFDGIKGLISDLLYKDREYADSVFRDFCWAMSAVMEIEGTEARVIEKIVNEEIAKWYTDGRID